MRIAHLILCCSLLALGTAVHAQERVQVPSLDQRGGAPIELTGYWFAARFAASKAAARAPVVVLLHGCGGAYNRQGELDARMRKYPALLNEQGWHVLVLDSLGARGEKELCTQKIGTRAVTMTQRRRDVLGALQWLAARPEVDAQRIALMGWSNGGSTVLAATDSAQGEVKASSVQPRAAVAFYPGCEAELKRGYRPTAPLLMLVGGSDDWTAPEPCKALAQQAADKVQIEVYEGAYHAFDGTLPVRVRHDVPNGTHPGQGVHVGGDAAAADASRQRMLAFFHQQLDGGAR